MEFPVATPRLLLRPFALSDGDDVLRYLSLPEVVRYTYQSPFSPGPEWDAYWATRVTRTDPSGAGLLPEAHLVENEFIKGEWTDELVYALLRREWEAQRASESTSPGWTRPEE